ncbi:DUF5131 family protein [Candidatus Poribacteria bacterium]
MSKIEWTEKTWNPITGCTRYSAGCKRCYAATMSHRLKAMGQAKYANGFKLTIHQDLLHQPLEWKKPKRIFVNSMSDTFHQDVPEEFIHGIFGAMKRAHWHQFQILTKRSERLLELDSALCWAENVWMGTTVECVDYIHRIECLSATGAHVKFLSLEPLLGPMPELNLDGIDWVIVGGESGPGARTMEAEWALDIRDQCIDRNVPFFFKQWGGVNKKKNGRLLDGRTWDEYPCQRSNFDAGAYDYVNYPTSEEKSMLLMSVPQDQLCHRSRDANIL